MAQPDIPTASLLGLPSELRNQIYQDYFTVDGGYVYDGDTDKLVQASGKPIDVSLRLSCRSIALETQDFPFSLNSIKLSTVYRSDWQKQAAYLKAIFWYQNKLQKCLLLQFRGLMTSDMYDHSNASISQHMSDIEDAITRYRNYYSEDRPFNALRWLKNTGDDDRLIATWGFEGGAFPFTLAIGRVLRIIAERYPQEFSAAMDQVKPGWSSSHSALDFFDLIVLPWSIPSLAEVTAIAEEWQVSEQGDRFLEWYKKDYVDTSYRGPICQYRQRRYFSAASLAIRFLNQVTKRQRLNIQSLVINEDRISEPRPESHPIGLIPFCIENANLHIDHRINVWRNFTLRADWPLDKYALGIVAHGVEYIPSEEEIVEDDYRQHFQVWQSDIQEGFLDWMVHTMDILGQGMPPDSYTLTLDGDPDLNHSTKMFSSLLEREIAELTLNSDIVAQGIFSSPEHPDYPFMTRRSMTEVYPVAKRSSLLQCNFTLDQPWDYKKIVEENGVEPRSLYPFKLRGNEFKYFDVSTPLVELRDMQLEFVDREKLMDSTDETMRKYGDMKIAFL